MSRRVGGKKGQMFWILNFKIIYIHIYINILYQYIHNLINAEDTTLMAESEEELKSLLMKLKEENGKSWLKT